MKIAILLFGQMRSFDTVIEKNINTMKNLDYDVFIHTSTNNTLHERKSPKNNSFQEKEDISTKLYSAYGDKIKSLVIDRDVSMAEKNTWKEYITAIKNKSSTDLNYESYRDGELAFDLQDYNKDGLFSFEEEIEEKLVLKNQKTEEKYQIIYSMAKRCGKYPYLSPISGRELQFYKKYELFKKLESYCLNNDVSYDAVIVTRLDVIFESINFDLLDMNKLHAYKDKSLKTICDIYLVSNFDTIKKVCEFWKYFRYYSFYETENLKKTADDNSVITGNLHAMIYHYHITKNNIPISYISDFNWGNLIRL